MASARTWGVSGLLGAALILSVAFAASLLADLYGTLSAEQRGRGQSNMAAISAAKQAVLLQPWRSGLRADLAWTFGVRGEGASMRTEYRRALRWTPASSYLWLEYAQALARSHRFNADYTLSLAKASQLSPNARPVQLSLALMGARHWNQGGEEDRKIWALNVARVLEVAPWDLLWQVLRERREGPFCGYMGAELGLSRWCFTMNAVRQICDGLPAGAEGRASGQCRQLGLEIPAIEADDSEPAP